MVPTATKDEGVGKKVHVSEGILDLALRVVIPTVAEEEVTNKVDVEDEMPELSLVDELVRVMAADVVVNATVVDKELGNLQ